MTMTAVARPPARRPAADSLRLSDPIQLGEVLARSGYFQDARDAAKAAVKVMAGAELGFGPIASMRGVDIIKGEVSLSAGLTAALVRGSAEYDYEIKRWDDQGCTLVFTRHGEPLSPEITFDQKDAERARLLGGDNYRKFPRSMYFARAMTMGARAHCPDLFGGSVYTPDELADPGQGEAERQEALVTAIKQEFNATEEPVPSSPEAPAKPMYSDVAAAKAEPEPAPVNAADPVSPEEAEKMQTYLQSVGAPEPFWRMGLMTLGLESLADLTKGQAHQLMADAKARFGD
jgi:hypothetical protein